MCRQSQEFKDIHEVNTLEALLVENQMLDYNYDKQCEDLEDSFDSIKPNNQSFSLYTARNTNEMQ